MFIVKKNLIEIRTPRIVGHSIIGTVIQIHKPGFLNKLLTKFIISTKI